MLDFRFLFIWLQIMLNNEYILYLQKDDTPFRVSEIVLCNGRLYC
uniref:Uncharacterized protein n=2 Tax=Anguilla anguilla TaxID=7936 RepID=A0A0E9VF17_ANGAN